MDTGSRSSEVIPAALWRRAAIVWMVIMLAETAHGAVRELFIAPVIGGLEARREQLIVGAFWVALTLVFEFTLGRAIGVSWPRIFADYNPLQGGLMLLGLAFMFCTPMFVKARIR